MDPSLAYDALVTPQHDLFSYGYMIHDIGSRLYVPELENLGVRIMHSRLRDRADSGALSTQCLMSELRSHTFRAGTAKSAITPVDCYELAKQLQRRSPGIESLFTNNSSRDSLHSCAV